jgi:hypothetical protein
LSRRLTLNLPESSLPAFEARDRHENRLGEPAFNEILRSRPRSILTLCCPFWHSIRRTPRPLGPLYP